MLRNTMRRNEQNKYERVEELVNHDGGKKKVADKLGNTKLNRLINIYIQKGKAGFVHSAPRIQLIKLSPKI